MALIQSHYKPDKTLKQHIDDVQIAANAILNRHSTQCFNLIADYLNHIIQFHDLGKAISEFQTYIKNPSKYKKPKHYKAHTPVSMIMWLLFGTENKIPKDVILVVCAVIWKHHGDFPTFDSIMNESLYEYEEDFRVSEYPTEQVRRELNLNLSSPLDADDFDIQDLFEDHYLEKRQISEAALLKVKGLFLFSILIESDRTFLALTEPHLNRKLILNEKIDILPSIVSDFLNEKSKTGQQNQTLNQERTKLRNTIISDSSSNSNIEGVSLPTGMGKTMVAAHWALTHRHQSEIKRKIIIVLPYLSIIDQTVKEYRRLFKDYEKESLLLEAHSIAERKYVDDSYENQTDKTNDAIDFLADTWDNDFVITTFDQFLYTLLSSKNSHLLRFHSLADALIIIDEIQALPCILWEPLSLALQTITEKLNSKILIMSATQPNFLPTKELVPYPEKIFNHQNRYELILKHNIELSLDDFIYICRERIKGESWHLKRVLIVLNTRASARKVLDSIESDISCDIFFLSADVTPKERLAAIEKIKENKPCLVISTQCIEAGVDIDMDLAIRDFAPLDSIIQCAGRCNRNGLKNRAKIEIVSLVNEKGKTFSGFVYDQTLLEKTSMVLHQKNRILEENIFLLVTDYFNKLKDSKDIGKKTAENWARWRESLDVKKLLRNENKKYDFIVVSQDHPKIGEQPLREAIVSSMAIDDRWDRKRKLRSLRTRISELSISVWANKNIDPDEIAENIGCYYLLKDKYYMPGKGFTLNLNPKRSSAVF